MVIMNIDGDEYWNQKILAKTFGSEGAAAGAMMVLNDGTLMGGMCVGIKRCGTKF